MNARAEPNEEPDLRHVIENWIIIAVSDILRPGQKRAIVGRDNLTREERERLRETAARKIARDAWNAHARDERVNVNRLRLHRSDQQHVAGLRTPNTDERKDGAERFDNGLEGAIARLVNLNPLHHRSAFRKPVGAALVIFEREDRRHAGHPRV